MNVKINSLGNYIEKYDEIIIGKNEYRLKASQLRKYFILFMLLLLTLKCIIILISKQSIKHQILMVIYLLDITTTIWVR